MNFPDPKPESDSKRKPAQGEATAGRHRAPDGGGGLIDQTQA
jgi:hypothetical protein